MIGRRCWTRTETRCLGSGGTRIASSRYSTWSDPIECAVFALDIASNQNLFYVLDVLVYLKYATVQHIYSKDGYKGYQL